MQQINSNGFAFAALRSRRRPGTDYSRNLEKSATGGIFTQCLILLQIFFDGTDLKDLNVHWLRSDIGVVSQIPVLFGFTVGKPWTG